MAAPSRFPAYEKASGVRAKTLQNARNFRKFRGFWAGAGELAPFLERSRYNHGLFTSSTRQGLGEAPPGSRLAADYGSSTGVVLFHAQISAHCLYWYGMLCTCPSANSDGITLACGPPMFCVLPA